MGVPLKSGGTGRATVSSLEVLSSASDGGVGVKGSLGRKWLVESGAARIQGLLVEVVDALGEDWLLDGRGVVQWLLDGVVSSGVDGLSERGALGEDGLLLSEAYGLNETGLLLASCLAAARATSEETSPLLHGSSTDDGLGNDGLLLEGAEVGDGLLNGVEVGDGLLVGAEV